MKEQDAFLVKEEKTLGMDYFKYTYSSRCLLLSILNGCVAFLSACMSLYYFSDDWAIMGLGRLAVSIVCAIMMVTCIITMKQYKKWQKSGSPAPSLYVMTQAFVWLGGVAWLTFLIGYTPVLFVRDYHMYSFGKWLGKTLGLAGMFLIPTVMRTVYFCRRRGVYGQAAADIEQKQDAVHRLETGEAKNLKPLSISFQQMSVRDEENHINTQNEKEVLKLISPVYASTHAEFLNTVFGANHQGYGQTVWPYHSNKDVVVWMVPFYGEHSDWKNRILEGGAVIREKYLGEDPNPLWRGKPLTLENLPGKRRIAVSVEDRFVSRSYTVLGVYDLSETESTDLNRVYRRLTDEKAKDLVPEIYEETK